MYLWLIVSAFYDFLLVMWSRYWNWNFNGV